MAQPREHHRYRLRVPVMFFWKDARDTQHEGIGLTRDISVRGVFVFTTSPLPLDANIKLKALLPLGGQVLPVRIFGQGQVVRVEPAPGSLPAGFAVAGGRIVFRKWAED
ncbi:MAG: PilZ domain-containing protein [Terriglobia bacterium]